MIIRQYKNEDCDVLAKLFYETVHSVNAKDYTAEQLSVWAENADALKSRRNALSEQFTLVAEINGAIAGFGSIDKSGCLDLLFVHRDYQKQGIGTALCDRLENGFEIIKTYASVTAKHFFERRGFSVVRAQEAERSGVKLKNYEMTKKNAPLH